MRPTKRGWIGLAFLLVAAVSGCGPITPASLAMKAGTWVAKEAITKELKRQREDKKNEKAQQAREHRGPATRQSE